MGAYPDRQSLGAPRSYALRKVENLRIGSSPCPPPGARGRSSSASWGDSRKTPGAGALAALLLGWRAYTVTLGAALGGVPIARAALGASLKRRRYHPMSSVNVRSQP